MGYVDTQLKAKYLKYQTFIWSFITELYQIILSHNLLLKCVGQGGQL